MAFVRYGRNHPDAYLVGRDGRGLRRLTHRGGLAPSWSPDGKWIAFIHRGDLYVVSTTGRGRRRLVDAARDEFGSEVMSVDLAGAAAALALPDEIP